MATALLLMALVLPVALFWLLASSTGLRSLIAAAIAVAVGWALSLAWAFAARESTTIATTFGWVCPAVLVFSTWLVWRFARRRAA